jgi:hypothetical protein
MPHLAHFGRGSFNLGHIVAIWSPPLQIWHPPNMVEEDDAIGLGTFLLKKLTSALFKAAICFSIILSKLAQHSFELSSSTRQLLNVSKSPYDA